ncbi:MAG: hypothetical protein IKG81_03350 [Bacteroidales bacterium]|nr:hypothetical protein [Bacteroidales bacterium]
MRKNFRIAALALAVCGLTAACNNNAPAELVDTIVPIDTIVVEEIIDSMPVIDTPVVEQPTVEKKATAKKKATVKKNEEKPKNTVSSVSIQTKKKSLEEVKGELKEGEGNSVKPKSLSPNKPSLTEAMKKN